MKKLTQLSLSLLLVCLLTTYTYSQNGYLKVAIKSNQLDSDSSYENLDTSSDWDFWNVTGLTTYSIEYQKNWKNKISFKPHLGHSSNSLLYGFNNPDLPIRSYSNRYVNVGFMANYHFNDNYRGLQVGGGPSVFYLLSHSLSILEKFTLITSDSEIEDNFNSLPIILQLEASYSFKVLRLLGLTWGLEIGYTPYIKLNGFVSGTSSALVRPLGLRLSANIWLGEQKS